MRIVHVDYCTTKDAKLKWIYGIHLEYRQSWRSARLSFSFAFKFQERRILYRISEGISL
jgi:hypothetical protein